MIVSVDIDADLLNAIDQAAGVQKISRDAAFRDALETWVAHQPRRERSTIDLSQLEFDPDFIPFDAYRPGPEAMPEFHVRKT
jgi:hypothetical protein